MWLNISSAPLACDMQWLSEPRRLSPCRSEVPACRHTLRQTEAAANNACQLTARLLW
ncbi:hypothetical protein NEUTE2DRAFT_142711 [Neurospora tetrasperma FGSC 2509]|nr:hypothetical protein NEUTE2DRAFT_142711 [Neurospora tetrasperma FGSC 2509]